MNTAIDIKILFLLIKSRANKRGETPLYCKLTSNNNSYRFSTGITISPEIWSQKRQQVIGSSSIVKNINLKIQEKIREIRKVESYFIQTQQEYTVQDIINKLNNKENHPFKTLIQAYNYNLKQMGSLSGVEYSDSTIVKAKQMKNNIEQYLKHEMRTSDWPIHKVNIQFLLEYEHYLRGSKQLSIATNNKNIQKLKSIMKMAFEFGVIDKPAFPSHKFKHEKPKIIYLTIDELERLEKYKFVQQRFHFVRDLFLFSVYTGLHYSDAMSLQQTNIIKGVDNKDWIVYTRQKTGVDIHIPILEKTKQLLFKFEDSNKGEEYLCRSPKNSDSLRS